MCKNRLCVQTGLFGQRPDFLGKTDFLGKANRSVEMGNTNSFLVITVEGTESNRDGIGTRFTLTTPDGVKQIREITSGSTHGGGDYRAAYFGLGGHAAADLEVRWPNGEVQVATAVAANQIVHLVEPASAP